MEFYTLGVNYYKNYKLPVCVAEDPLILAEVEAGDYYKILLITSGTCHFQLGQKEFVLTGPYAICLNEADRIKFYEVPENSLRILMFKPTVINDGLSVENINNSRAVLSHTEYQDMYYVEQFKHNAELNIKILPLKTIDSSLIEHKIQLMKETLFKQETGYWPCRSRSYLFEILFFLARQEEKEEPVKSLPIYNGCSKLAVDVIYYLQSRYYQKITIDKLTEEFHTNRTTLLAEFKKYTGQSINHYLIQLRLNMASTMLRDTKLSVDEICERTGFSEISYFSKAFKKRLNYTPSEYRRMNNPLEGLHP